MGFVKAARERFDLFTEILTDAQGRAFAILFYYTIMIPFGLGGSLAGDFLHRKEAVRWLDREPVGTTLEEAQRQG